ncbi:hypothetical protein [Aquimarina sp. 2201CG5-10]|uniref:hypothetical protein n=1 Tax=Aquimarina callyspongiae TaxID=3098150 RepID=UPI002AB50F94|nr:hypothetical protein [Aquimarina sp. 2201CG5-10]MDY8136152.1 hypothetical protein [Aquimarina sp. 2201CG5-10]
MSFNQILTILIILGVLMSLTGLGLSNFTVETENDFLGAIGLWLLEVSGMFLLLRNGTFLKTRYFSVVIGLIVIMLIGSLFKIMHWPFGIEVNIVLSIICISILIMYFLHFIKKPIKKRLDYLKLAWVLVLYLGATLKLHHIISREYRILTTVLMILALMEYMLPRIKNKTLFE